MPRSTPETGGSASIGGSDDIGDVMGAVPTITIGYPANIPNVIFHHATAAMVMATPIAPKGTVAGAKAVAMTVNDLLTRPKLLADAQTDYRDVQLKTQSYHPVLKAADQPRRNSDVSGKRVSGRVEAR